MDAEMAATSGEDYAMPARRPRWPLALAVLVVIAAAILLAWRL